MHFDDVLEDVGDFGPFQWRLWLASCLTSFAYVMVNLAQVFLAGQSDHWCQAPELDNVNCTRWSLTETQCIEAKRSVAIPLAIDSDSVYEYENCVRYNLIGIQPSDWFPGWDTSDVTNDTIECDAGWVYDTSQFKATIITDFNLVCDKGTIPDFAQSMFFVGVLIGSALFGVMSDWIGRYWTFLITLLLCVSSGFLTALSNSYVMYIIVRTIAGGAWQGMNLCCFILVNECVSPSKRALTSAISNFWYSSGYMLLALFGYLIRGWRVLMFVLVSPVLLILLQFTLISESPRWLLSKGRIEDAEKVITKIAKLNKKELPNDYFKNIELQESEKKTEDPVTQNASIKDLFRYRWLMIKTIILMFCWCVISLAYYGLSLSTGDLGSDFYLSFFISGAVEVPGYIYVLFAIDWFGRRPNQGGSMILGGVACIVAVFIPLGVWRTTVAMIGKFFVTISFSIVYIYTAELFPTPVRNAGIGLCSTVGRIGSICAPLIFFLEDYWTPLPYIFFGALAVIGGLLALILPETNKKNLPQTIQEGQDFGRKKKSQPVSPGEEEDVELHAHNNPTFEEK